MKWWAGAILLLVIALLFGMDLLAYAMYVLLAVMIVSRFVTRATVSASLALSPSDTLGPVPLTSSPMRSYRGREHVSVAKDEQMRSKRSPALYP